MVSLSPFESKVSCGAYRAAAHEAVSGLTITSLCETGSLSATEGFRAHHAAELRRALGQAAVGSPLVVMTAHSLPESDLEQADPYVTGLRQVADAVAEHAGLEVGSERDGVAGLAGIEAWGSGATGAPWVLAYQSKGVRPGAWLAPDIDDVMRAGAEAGHTKVILVPIGFATDHMETMYDLDVVAEAKARDLGIDFVRTAVPNDNELLISALEQLVEQHL
jgi:ferrochelatase